MNLYWTPFVTKIVNNFVISDHEFAHLAIIRVTFGSQHQLVSRPDKVMSQNSHVNYRIVRIPPGSRKNEIISRILTWFDIVWRPLIKAVYTIFPGSLFFWMLTSWHVCCPRYFFSKGETDVLVRWFRCQHHKRRFHLNDPEPWRWQRKLPGFNTVASRSPRAWRHADPKDDDPNW